MPLNDRQIKNAKPQAKPYKLADSYSLYMLVKPNGGKYWHFDYAIDGKRKTLAKRNASVNPRHCHQPENPPVH